MSTNNNVIFNWIKQLKQNKKQKQKPSTNVYNWLNSTVDKIKNKYNVFKKLLFNLENAVSDNLNNIIKLQSIVSDTNKATENIDKLNVAILNELKLPPIPSYDIATHNESIRQLETHINSELNKITPTDIQINQPAIPNERIQSLETHINSELNKITPPPIQINQPAIPNESIQSLETHINSELNNSIDISKKPINVINNIQNKKVMLDWLQMIIAKYRLKRAIEKNMKEIITNATLKDNIPDIKPLEQLIENGLMKLIGITHLAESTETPIISINKSIMVDENVLKQNYGNAIQISGKTVKELNERFGNTHIGNSIIIDHQVNMPSIKINNKDQNMSNIIFNQLGNQYIAELKEFPIVYVNKNQLDNQNKLISPVQ